MVGEGRECEERKRRGGRRGEGGEGRRGKGGKGRRGKGRKVMRE